MDNLLQAMAASSKLGPYTWMVDEGSALGKPGERLVIRELLGVGIAAARERLEKMRALNNPQVLQPYEIVYENDRLFLVRRWVAGVSLEPTITPRQATDILDLAVSLPDDFLVYDLRPEHIISTQQGLVLVDPGWNPVGCNPFSSPEQNGRGGPVVKSLNYQVGITLLYLLRGVKPPDALTLLIPEEEPPLVECLPKGIAQKLNRLLEAEPAARISLAVMAKEFRGWLYYLGEEKELPEAVPGVPAGVVTATENGDPLSKVPVQHVLKTTGEEQAAPVAPSLARSLSTEDVTRALDDKKLRQAKLKARNLGIKRTSLALLIGIPALLAFVAGGFYHAHTHPDSQHFPTAMDAARGAYDLAKDASKATLTATVGEADADGNYNLLGLTKNKQALNGEVPCPSGDSLPISWTSPRDGAPMILIPGGPFAEGPSSEAGPGARSKIVDVPPFYIDRYEVTNKQFAKFVKDSGYKPEGRWREFATPSRANHPVICVSWFDAQAYAKWAGKRLPNAHEWEKAARGGDGRLYPWGNKNILKNLNCQETGYGNTTPVGTFPQGASPYGVEDMAGNVWEWLDEWYVPLGQGAEEIPMTRMVRGGSRNDACADCSVVSVKGVFPESSALVSSGFRCVLDPAEGSGKDSRRDKDKKQKALARKKAQQRPKKTKPVSWRPGEKGDMQFKNVLPGVKTQNPPEFPQYSGRSIAPPVEVSEPVPVQPPSSPAYDTPAASAGNFPQGVDPSKYRLEPGDLHNESAPIPSEYHMGEGTVMKMSSEMVPADDGRLTGEQPLY